MDKTASPTSSRIATTLHRLPGATWSYQQLSRLTFRDSDQYWKERYRRGGNSGPGSYGRLAEFKAEVLNQLVSRHAIQSVVELGCGDGNQLQLADYPEYLGLDISTEAIRRCVELFRDDPRKSFTLFDPCNFQANRPMFAADLSMSIDVIYHLVEDHIYDAYMHALFAFSKHLTVIYSSNRADLPSAAHVRHRCVTDWVTKNAFDFELMEVIENRYPHDPRRPRESSHADFYVFQRSQEPTQTSVAQ